MEMIWTYLGLYRRSSWWSNFKVTGSAGKRAYASKQEAVWQRLAEKAAKEFGLKDLDTLHQFCTSE
jgi:hypothetical protein